MLQVQTEVPTSGNVKCLNRRSYLADAVLDGLLHRRVQPLRPRIDEVADPGSAPFRMLDTSLCANTQPSHLIVSTTHMQEFYQIGSATDRFQPLYIGENKI